MLKATLVEYLGIIQAVKSKLINQPDPAAEKFIAALGEISGIYSATESELGRYLSIHLDPQGGNQEERKTLTSLESGAIALRRSEARGHCHKIMNIHDRYLNKWFSRVLNPNENDQMRNLFHEFGEFEGGFLYRLDRATSWLAREAEETLNLLDQGKVTEANKRIRTARKEVLPLRKQMSRAMQQMLDLQAELIDLTEAVGASR